MQFYDSSGKKGLVQDAWRRIFNNTDDHSADYPLLDMAASMNSYYDDVITKIMQSDHTWSWDDNNQTDLPIARVDIVAGQIDYGIGGDTYLKISRVEIKDNNGNWKQLMQFSSDMLVGRALGELATQSGVPSFYRLQGNSLFFDITPNYGSTQGLRIFYQRAELVFLGNGSDNSKVPGFASQFHKILSVGCALDYCLNADMEAKVATLDQMLHGTFIRTKGRIGGLFIDLQDFYENRNNNKVTARLSNEDYGQRGLSGGWPSNQNNRSPYGF